MMNKIKKICYLCGQELEGECDRDHVPPKQFYPEQYKKNHSPNLLTLPVHKPCNKLYQKDEEYFVHSIGPLAKGSYSGNELWRDMEKKFTRPQGQRLGRMVLKEFESRPSGLYLPEGKVPKWFDKKRVWRVVWKITRGLFFNEYGRYLPEGTQKDFFIIPEGEKPPPEFDFVLAAPEKGQYPVVFNYKFIAIPEDNSHVWAMLFWERLINIIAFHDPDCKCDKCSKQAV